jgi:hypothetical protein
MDLLLGMREHTAIAGQAVILKLTSSDNITLFLIIAHLLTIQVN